MRLKESGVGIGKGSGGVSSDYCRLLDSRRFFSQDDIFSVPHKRGGGSEKTGMQSIVVQSELSQNPQPAMEQQQIKTSHSKLTRTPSSLLRSPTIKSGIDSFASLGEETAIEENYSKTNKWTKRGGGSYRDDILSSSCEKLPRFKFQLLLPPLVMVLIPCFWYYIKAMQNRGLNSGSDGIALGLWFDFFSALVFVTAVVISLKIAFPDFRVGFRLPSMRLVRGALGQSWGCLAVSWVKPLAAFLSDERYRRKIKGSPSVTWTIGSKSKCERSKIVREGVEVYSNGDVYEGEFHQGKCSGSGVYYYYVNGRYEGDWIDGKYDGYGVETWARGSRYRGQYRQGLRHGYGVYRFYTGDMYAGEWSNGQSHGYGVQTCEDGSRYVGEFRWGVKHGLGFYHFRNGDTYAGEYFADKMHGFGVYHFANGHRYEGAWHEGRKQGLGMYTFRSGETQSGHWHCGMLKTPSTDNSRTGSPKPKGGIHSKVLIAVQEARRAAGKAFEVPRVDDRVNKAIAAANRAATAARVAAVKAVQKRMDGNVPAVDV